MAEKFDMKGGYRVIENAILIDSTPAGISLYNKSKDVISRNAVTIDKVVAQIKQCDILLRISEHIGREKTNYLIEIENWRNAFNTFCLLASFDIDFSISTRELMNAKNLPEQMYYIKSIYIHLYRYLERINSEFGVIKPLADRYGLIQNYKRSSKAISEFRSKYYSQIHDRRNKLYAHIKDNKDFLEYQNDCINMKIQEETDMCIEFLTASSTLNELLSEISAIITSEMPKVMQKITEESRSIDNKIINVIEKVRGVDTELAEQIESDINKMKQGINDTVSKIFKSTKK